MHVLVEIRIRVPPRATRDGLTEKEKQRARHGTRKKGTKFVTVRL